MTIPRASLTFLALFCFGNSFAQGYVLKGKITGINDGWAFVRHRQKEKTDSARIHNGNFWITGTAILPEFCSFGLTIDGIKDYYLSFFIERGNFRMMANKDSLNDISILFTGCEAEKEFQQFQMRVHQIDQQHYPQTKANAELEKLTRGYALRHPGSYISAFALISYETDPAALSRLYGQLTPEIQRSYFGQQIRDHIRPHQ